MTTSCQMNSSNTELLTGPVVLQEDQYQQLSGSVDDGSDCSNKTRRLRCLTPAH